MARQLPIVYGLSLWQPWASLMWVGAKCVETRHWPPLHIGIFLAIHAAKKWDASLRLTALDRNFQACLQCEPDDLPRGCFGAIVWLKGWYSTNYEAPSENELEFQFGNYSPNRYGWVCPRVWTFETPIPAQGQRRLWRLDSTEMLAALRQRQRDDLLSFYEEQEARRF